MNLFQFVVEFVDGGFRFGDFFFPPYENLLQFVFEFVFFIGTFLGGSLSPVLSSLSMVPLTFTSRLP